MGGFLTILPLSFVMIAGPQIISAVFLSTTENWGRNSLAFVAGAALSITAFVTAAYLVVKGAKSAAGESNQGTSSDAIDVVILLILVVLAVMTYMKRNDSEPPKWMGKLQTATPKFSFTLGFLLLGVFPTDILTSVTVGSHLATNGKPWADSLAFIGLTLLLLGLPAILVALLGKRARILLPEVRDWMNTHSWIVSEIVIALFIGITANSIASG